MKAFLRTISMFQTSNPAYFSRRALCVAGVVREVSHVSQSSTLTPSNSLNFSNNHLSRDELLKSHGIIDKNIFQKINKSTALSRSASHEWKNVLDSLGACGCSSQDVVAMVLQYPELLNIRGENIKQFWNVWLDQFRNHEMARNLMVAHPLFLSLKEADIRDKINLLKAVVVSRKNIAILLMHCPRVMFHSISELEKVIDYLSATMVVKNVAEYYKSGALGCTLEEIMERHVFLERCGKYKTPNLKQSESVPTGNPTLMDIYDSSEKKFATKFAGVTQEEFVVFQRLFKEENQTQDIDSSDSDEDE